MNEQIQQLRAFVRTVWPYRWAALVMAGLVCAAGWAYVYWLPNQYDVTAKIFVDTRSMLRPLLKGIAVDNQLLQDSALLMRQTLLTRPNLEEVARHTDMDLKAQTPEEFDMLVIRLAETLKVTGTSKDNIYELTYEDDDPKLAKRVVDELLNTFMESTLGDTRKETAVTQKFLDQQISEYERKLIDAEERLKEFKRKNMAVMPGTDDDYFSRMKQAEENLNRARLELNEATQRRDELARQISGEEPVFGMVDTATPATSPALSQIDSRLEKLRQKLDELLLNYTDKHPDVVATRETITSLEQDRERESAKAAEQPQAPSASPLGQNPAYQEIKVQLATAEADVAALTSRVKEYEKRVTDLKKLVDTVPEVEAELKRLDRDYGFNKQQYEELIKRRESARISEEADKSADNIQLKIIEPPRVPLVPTGPNRLRLVSLVFLSSLAAGAGAAFLLSQVNPRFFTTQMLREFTDIPVLGTVTMIQNARQRAERRMELAFFSLMFLVLVAAFSGLIALQLMNVDLHLHLTALFNQLNGLIGSRV